MCQALIQEDQGNSNSQEDNDKSESNHRTSMKSVVVGPNAISVMARNESSKTVTTSSAEECYCNGCPIASHREESVTECMTETEYDCSESFQQSSIVSSVEGELSTSCKRKIKWGKVHQRDYPIICGDHPDCSRGPPLTVAWDAVSEACHSVDEYEQAKVAAGREVAVVSHRGHLARRQLLRSLGCSDDDIEECQVRAHQSRRQRDRTVARLRFEKYHIARETLARRVRNIFGPKEPKLLVRCSVREVSLLSSTHR